MTTKNELMNIVEELIDSTVKKKYCIQQYNEENISDVNKRCLNILKPLISKDNIFNNLKSLINNNKYIFAGSILFGLGNDTVKCSLSNCYYIPINEDSIDGIYNCLNECAKTFSYRGGAGTDITILRPKGAPVSNAAVISSGAVSFMSLMSSSVKTIGQFGRRGALLISIDIRHPDALDFIWSKAKPESVFEKDTFTGLCPDISGANISLKIPNSFIEAVQENKNWDFIFPDIYHEMYKTKWKGDYDDWINAGYPVITYNSIPAREILNQIAEASWLCGDPGILFIDHVKKWTPCSFDNKLKPRGVNPCIPEWSPVLTPNGYKRFIDIENNVHINGRSWQCSDVFITQELDDVYELELESGIKSWYTKDHKISKIINIDCNSSTLINDDELQNLKPNDYVETDYTPISYIKNQNEYDKGLLSGLVFENGLINNKLLQININKIEIYNIIKNIFTQSVIISNDNYQVVDKSSIQNFINFFGCNNKDDFTLYNKSISFSLGFINSLISFNAMIINSKMNKEIKILQNNKYKIISEIQLILASLGIYSYINDEKQLCIPDIKTFNKHIILIHKGKKELINKILQKYNYQTDTYLNKWYKTKQKIKSIIKLDKQYPVYDVSVPGPNRMINGTVNVSNCGEQQLGDYNNCLLACLVMHKFVKNPFTQQAEFDFDSFNNAVKTGIYTLDVISDINIEKHPLQKQREHDAYGKRVGQEITGVADMLAMLGLKYGSDESINLLEDILFCKVITEIETSIELSKEKGYAPCFKSKKSREKFIKQPYINRILNSLLPSRANFIKNNILTYGLRNSSFNTVGPCGTISIISDNCCNGIEPLYALSYQRKSRINKTINVFHYPILKYFPKDISNLSNTEVKRLTNYIESFELDYKDRIKMQSVIQKWTDSSVSSTINLPNNSTIKDISDIYLCAYENNLKGITIYRDNSKSCSVLSTGDEKTNVENKLNDLPIESYLARRKKELSGTMRSYRNIANWKNAKVYITIVVDNDGLPVEVFANVPFECGIDSNGNYNNILYNERQTNWNAICRLCSILLRLKTPISIINKQLQKAAPNMVELPAIIMRLLKQFETNLDKKEIEEIKTSETGGEYCYNCGKNGLIHQGGCNVCVLCGESSCG